MTKVLLPLLVVLAARGAGAHSVPIPPSACTPDIEMVVPSVGVRAVAAAGGPADQLRIVYDTGASLAQLCPADAVDPLGKCAAAPARALLGLGPSATLAFPSVFGARLLASGDLRAGGVPLVLTVDGTPFTVPVDFTTGPAAAGTDIADAPGSPVASDGRFVLVGGALLTGLPAPLTDAPALLRLVCGAAPAPDLDQFALAPSATKLAGTITSSGIRLRAKLVEGGAPADFARPAVLQVMAAGRVLGSFSLPDGLTPRGRKAFAGESASRQKSIDVRRIRRKPVATYQVTLRLSGALAPLPPDGATVELVSDLGGMVSRVSRPFRARRGGTALKAG